MCTTDDENIRAGYVIDGREAQLLSAMKLFEKYPLIALQRALSADGSQSGYRCSIPLYANDPGKEGQLIATVNGDGATAAKAILAAIVAFEAQRS